MLLLSVVAALALGLSFSSNSPSASASPPRARQQLLQGKHNAKQCTSNELYIDDSTLTGAGSGVFSKTGLRTGTWCCSYEGFHTRRPQSLDELKYGLETSIGGVIVGVHPPNETQIEECAVGSMVNDAAIPLLHHPTSLSQVRQAAISYKQRSEAAANIISKEGAHGRLVMYSRKAVPPGGELFFSYGILHWLNVIQHEHDNPMLVILCFMAKYSFVQPPPPSRPQFWYHVDEEKVFMAANPLSDAYVPHFMQYMGLHPSGLNSSMLSAFDALDRPLLERLGCESGCSLLAKVNALISYLAEDHTTLDVAFDEADTRYYPQYTPAA